MKTAVCLGFPRLGVHPSLWKERGIRSSSSVSTAGSEPSGSRQHPGVHMAPAQTTLGDEHLILRLALLHVWALAHAPNSTPAGLTPRGQHFLIHTKVPHVRYQDGWCQELGLGEHQGLGFRGGGGRLVQQEQKVLGGEAVWSVQASSDPKVMELKPS